MTLPTATAPTPKTTVKSSAVQVVLARVVAFADACSPRRLKERTGRIVRYLGIHWPWVLVALMYAAASYLPLSWAWVPWTQPRSLETFQLWVPLAIVIASWGRRDQIEAAWNRSKRKQGMARVGPYEAGNAIPLFVGCVALLLVHLVQVKGYALIALIIIAWGVLYQAYGMRVMRALRVPLLLFPLMIPLPDSGVDKVRDFTRGQILNGLCTVLDALHRPAVTDGANIRFLKNNFVANMSPTGGGIDVGTGIDVSFLASLAVITYCLSKKRSGGQIAVSVATAFLLGIVLNFARLLMIALVVERSPSVAFFSTYNTYVFAALVYVLTFPIAHGIIVGFRRLFVAPPGGMRRRSSSFQIFLMRLGKIVAMPFYPILAALGLAGRGARRVGTYARRGSGRTSRSLKVFQPVVRVLLLPVILVTRLLKRTEKRLEWLMRRKIPFVPRGGRNRNFRRPDRFR